MLLVRIVLHELFELVKISRLNSHFCQSVLNHFQAGRRNTGKIDLSLGVKVKVLLNSRVGKGNFTPNLSQHRA
jgi:hypothetical protein